MELQLLFDAADKAKRYVKNVPNHTNIQLLGRLKTPNAMEVVTNPNYVNDMKCLIKGWEKYTHEHLSQKPT